MSTLGIPDERLERFLEPALTRWNRLEFAELADLKAEPMSDDPSALVSYVDCVQTSYGYDFVEFVVECRGEFALTFRVEGRPGELSTERYHPVVIPNGDEAAARAWLERVTRPYAG